MRRVKKVACVLLVACLVFMSIPLTVFAEEPTSMVTQEETAEEAVVETDEEAKGAETIEGTEEAEEPAEPEEQASTLSGAETVNISDGEIILTATADDGMKVTLTAEVDAFATSEGLELIAEVMNDAAEAEAEIDKQADAENVAKRVTYDIRVEKDGVEQQPVEGKEVHVAFSLSEVPSGADEVTIYHLDETDGLEVIASETLTEDKGATVDATEVAEATETENTSELVSVTEEELEDIELINDLTVEGDTDSFSLYTVDFTYDDKTVSIPGDSTRNDLANVLAEVGITDPIEYVEVYSDNEFKNKCEDGIVRDGEEVLFKVYQENSTWYVDAVNAFTSEHGIIVSTLAKTEYKVKVTDDSITYTEVSASYVRDMFNNSDGKVKLTENLKITNKDVDINITKGSGEFDLNGYRLLVSDKALKFGGSGTWNIYDSTYNHTKDKNAVGWLDSNGNCAIETSGSAIVNIYSGYFHPNAQYGMVGTINVLGGRFEGTNGWGAMGKRWAGGKFPDSSNKPSDKNIDGTYIPDMTGGPEVLPNPGASSPARIAQITSGGAISGKTSITNGIADGATVVMLMDLTGDISIPADTTVIINLNGKVLEGNITVSTGGKLTLQDFNMCTEHTGDYATLPSGGVVKGKVVNNGTFIMDGGTITGGSVCGITNNNNLTISRGTIKGNTQSGVTNNGTLTLSGCPVIKDNTNGETPYACNLYLNNTTFTIAASGMDNDADISISVPATATIPYTLSGTNDTDYHSCFSSDNASYEVAYVNKTLVLKVPGGPTPPGPTPPGPTPAPEPTPDPEPEKSTSKGGESWTAEPTAYGTSSVPIADGSWKSVDGSFTYTVNGQPLMNAKAWITYTAADGKQYTGCFYFDKTGKMAIGWQLINGVWYYFEPAAGPTQGIMYISRTTPDGYVVDAEGKWVQG